MKFTETALAGAYLIELELKEDERGFLARTFCAREFAARGLQNDIAQANLSFNARRGTLRGMHFQEQPFSEAKLIQCSRGSLHDVIIDLRPDSETYCRWIGIDLSESDRRLLYVPEGFGHGFQTLEDNTALLYLMFEFYAPEYARGVRWNDPVFGIDWPISEPIISEKDRHLPDYER